jgi:ElaB/YqjD/DUF883 family membrane-anchored ribosome-binding protein
MASNPVDAATEAAEAARTRVSATMDDIQTRLDPRRIVGDAVAKVQTGSRALATQASETARAHPLAIGAAVAALGLALFARNRLANATVDLGDGTADYTDYDDGYGNDDVFDAALAPPKALVEAAKERVEATPGVAILVGLVAGAALGALLPVSEAERRTLGETGDRLSAAVRAAARRAAEEMDDAGLSLDAVKAKAGEATRKARKAAQSVADAARAELKG